LDHRQAVVTSRNKHRITLFILGYGVADEVGNGSRDPHSVVAKGEFLPAPGPEDEYCHRGEEVEKADGGGREW
jgi:hypothetical protein